MNTHTKSIQRLAPAAFCAFAFMLTAIASQDSGTDAMHAAAISPEERQELVVQAAQEEVAKGGLRSEVERWFAL